MPRQFPTLLCMLTLLALAATPLAAAQPAASGPGADTDPSLGTVIQAPLQDALDQALTETCNEGFSIEVPFSQCTVEDCIDLCAAEGADTIGPVVSRFNCICVCCTG